MIEQLNLFDFRRSVEWHGLRLRAREKYPRFEDAVVQHGGRLVGARRWSDPRLREEARVCKRSLTAFEKQGLIRWDGDDLVLVHFDFSAAQRAAEKASRFSKIQSVRGRAGAQIRWQSARCRTDQCTDQYTDQLLGDNHTESLDRPIAGAIADGIARARSRSSLDLPSPPDPDPEEEEEKRPDGPEPEPDPVAPPSPEPSAEFEMSSGERTIWRALPERRQWMPHVRAFLDACRAASAGNHSNEWVLVVEKLKRQYANDMYRFPFAQDLIAKFGHLVRRRPTRGCPCGCNAIERSRRRLEEHPPPIPDAHVAGTQTDPWEAEWTREHPDEPYPGRMEALRRLRAEHRS